MSNEKVHIPHEKVSFTKIHPNISFTILVRKEITDDERMINDLYYYLI